MTNTVIVSETNYNVTVDEQNNITIEIDKPSVGPAGYTGSSGYTGSVGSQGVSGYTGSQGSQGYTGSQGDVGYVGSQGTTGYVGSKGDTGYVGSQGNAGYVGSSGATGFTGSAGSIGYTGSYGQVGPVGYTGSQGTTGTSGYVGSQGTAGYVGSTGTGLTLAEVQEDGHLWVYLSDNSQQDAGYVIGPIGYVGSQGVTGYVGSTGYTGSQGTSTGRFYYFNQSVTTHGYPTLGTVPTTASESALTVSAAGNTTTLLTTYISEPFEFSLIPGGAQRFTINALKANANNNIRLFATLKLADQNGNVIQTIGNTNEGILDHNNGNPVVVYCDIVLPTTAVTIGYHMIVEIHVINGSSNATNVTMYTEGNANYSFVITSLAAAQGPIGYTGSQGIQGVQGNTGYVGSQGTTGYVGSAGTNGTTGYVGSKGDVGYVGSVGYTGSAGGADLAIDIQRFGFMNQDETTVAFDDTVHMLTITPVGSTWSYYRSGIKHTITGAKSASIAAPADGTQYFFYIAGDDGTLSYSTSPWDLATGTTVPVAMVFWNSTQTPKYHLQEERHSCKIDRRQHYHDHVIIGSRLRTIGALSGYSLTTDTDAAKTFGIADSVLIDEDIIMALGALAEPNGTTTDYSVAYRTASTTWNWTQSAMPFKYNSGTNWIQWDNAGTLTDGINNRYYNSYILFTNINGAFRYTIIPGRGQFTTLALAQAEDPATFTFSNFLTAEFVIGYQLTWVGSGTATSKGKCTLAALPKQIAVAALATSSTAGSIEHSSLAGLSGDDHTQYALNTNERVAIHTTTPAIGQALGYNGSQWVNTSVVGYTGSAGTTGYVGSQGSTGYVGSAGSGAPVVITPAFASPTMSINVSGASYVDIALTGNTQIGFTGGVAGQKFILDMEQDATGSRLVTFDSSVSYGTDITAAPTLTTTPNKRDLLGFVFDGDGNKYYLIAYARGY